MRMHHEYLSSKRKACFVTLTYSPKCLPLVLDSNNVPRETLFKKDVQNYFKRLRNNVDKKIRYYAAGEYGSKGNRPHYHLCIFGLTPDAWKDASGFVYLENKDTCDIGFDSVWKMGIVSVSHDFGVEAGAYAAKYATKVIRAKGFSYAPRIPPFQLQSLGIGKEYALKNGDDIKKNSTSHNQATKNQYPATTKNSLTSPTKIIKTLSKKKMNF